MRLGGRQRRTVPPPPSAPPEPTRPWPCRQAMRRAGPRRSRGEGSEARLGLRRPLRRRQRGCRAQRRARRPRRVRRLCNLPSRLVRCPRRNACGRGNQPGWCCPECDCESEFSNGVEPARVVVADQPLPVQLLEAGVVRVELEWLVQKIRAEGAQRVHHSQELETVGGVAAFLDGEFA